MSNTIQELKKTYEEQGVNVSASFVHYTDYTDYGDMYNEYADYGDDD